MKQKLPLYLIILFSVAIFKVNASNKVMERAVESGQTSAVSKSSAAQIDIQAALVEAVTKGPISKIEPLVRDGADVNKENPGGSTLLEQAVMLRREDIVFLLLENKANVNQPTKMRGRTPLLEAAAHGTVTVVSLLLHHKANIAARDNENNAAFDLAKGHQQEGIMKLLRSEALQIVLKKRVALQSISASTIDE